MTKINEDLFGRTIVISWRELDVRPGFNYSRESLVRVEGVVRDVSAFGLWVALVGRTRPINLDSGPEKTVLVDYTKLRWTPEQIQRIHRPLSKQKGIKE